MPGGFVPAQDKQYLVGFAQLPDGATLDRTEEVIRRMGEIALEAAGRRERGRLPGPVDQRLHQQLERRHRVRRPLKPFEERKDPGRSAAAPSRRQLNQKFAGIQDAFIAMFPPPPVQGLGTIGGFKLQIEDRAGLGYEALDEATKAFIAKASQGAGAGRPVLELPGQRAAALSPTSTAPRRASSACR